MNIPFHQYNFDDSEKQAVNDVLSSGWLTAGSKCLEFEGIFSDYKNGCFAISVAHATAGLELILDALDLPPHSEILVPTLTFYATAGACITRKYRVRLVDVQADTLMPSVEDYARQYTPYTSALILVHLSGNCMDIDAVLEFANKYKLKIIEDCSHAIETKWKNKPTGTLGDAGSFSFYPNKNITAAEGGMVTTNNEATAQKINILKNQGINKSTQQRSQNKNFYEHYDIVDFGRKANMNDLQACIGIAQLKKIDEFYRRRLEIVNKYDKAFMDIAGIQRPLILSECLPAHHLYILKLEMNEFKVSKSELMNQIILRGIQLSVHYKPLHLMTVFQYPASLLPVASQLYESIFTLPLYPKLKDEEVNYIIEVVSEVLNLNKK